MAPRKNIWLTIFITLLLWLIFTLLVINISPDFSSKFSIFNHQLSISITKIAFFTILLTALTLTLGLIFKSRGKALIISVTLVTFLFLKMLQVVNWLTILLLLTIAIIIYLA